MVAVPKKHRPPAKRASSTAAIADAPPAESFDAESPLTPKANPELVFGLVGPVGVDLDPVIDALSKELKIAQYRTQTIRLSDQIQRFFGSDHSRESEDERIVSLMDEGTRLRERSERGDAVALLAIAEIRRVRAEVLGGRAEKNA